MHLAADLQLYGCLEELVTLLLQEEEICYLFPVQDPGISPLPSETGARHFVLSKASF